jgi:hypothetical protein
MGERCKLASWGHWLLFIIVGMLLNGRLFKGEIDILEGVNDHGPNLVTMHTTPGKRFTSRGLHSR